MKKLLLLLLIAPMIGNSQLLNLPVSRAIMISETGEYIVPQGKIWQLLSTREVNGLIRINRYEYQITPLNQAPFDNGQYIHGNIVLSEGTIFRNLATFNNLTFVEFDLDAQNLASNVPQQTTPTLYPNPTSSLLALNSDKEYDIEVYDMAGNKVMALTGNTIDMSHLSSATYIVKALDKVENEEVSYKVVKN